MDDQLLVSLVLGGVGVVVVDAVGVVGEGGEPEEEGGVGGYVAASGGSRGLSFDGGVFGWGVGVDDGLVFGDGGSVVAGDVVADLDED